MKSNNTPLNILASFAYLEGAKEFQNVLFDSSMSGIANVMIDSGAFTLHNAKKKRDWLTVDSYCKFLDAYGDKVEKYVMLDVIGDDEKSKENYETMLKRGYNPMFVFTMADNDYSYVSDAVKNNPFLCVAGGVSTKGDWIKQRFQKVYAKTQAKIHGLGYVTYPNMFQLNLNSVDSSSWLQAPLVYGTIPYFSNGMKGFTYKDVLKKKKKLPIEAIRLFEKAKITPKDFSNLDFHKGNRSIGFMMSIVAYLEYQKVAKRTGLNLFLAVANIDQLRAILFVNEKLNTNQLNYHEFRKL